MKHIDLNCDMGEMAEMLADGSQAALMRFITSANVACGGHAGDAEMMRTTIEQALAAGVAIGAHPGLRGRREFRADRKKLVARKKSLRPFIVKLWRSTKLRNRAARGWCM